MQFLLTQRFQHIYLAAAEQGTVYFKRRIFRCCTDQGYDSFFHSTQQRILLTFIKPVDFIDKQDYFFLFAGPLQSLPVLLLPRMKWRSGYKKGIAGYGQLYWQSWFYLCPGGPQRIMEGILPCSRAVRRILPLPVRCF